MTLTYFQPSARLRPGPRRSGGLRAVLMFAAMLTAGNATRANDIPQDIQIDLSSIVVSRDELVCLALNDYWEARSEEIGGRIAVAHVVLNRTMDSRFPSTLCDVIKQTKTQGTSQRCQFSWYCDHKDEVISGTKEWRDSLKIAAAVLQKDAAIPDPTGGALWYHADFTRPAWAMDFESTTIIGTHVFYREPDNLRAASRPRRPFIYRLNAFAEFIARRDGRRVTTVAMAREAISPVAMKDGSVAPQPVAR